jgi:hypothetical protein|tara:strand:- start:1068 stop:1589 length:522 start_codon:yes stop_codon:yes gene_type:complete
MNLLFVISASLWAWLVSRCIAFGPKAKAMCWTPNMHADTWYRLTPIPAKLPHAMFKFIPLFIAITSITPLYIHNNIVHALTVVLLVSEHAYIPIFVAHIHSKYTLALWAVINWGMNAVIIKLLGSWILGITIACKMVLHAWFFMVEIYIIFNKIEIQREALEYQERQNRVMIV